MGVIDSKIDIVIAKLTKVNKKNLLQERSFIFNS
jgi:hypothetical protein